MSRGRGFRLLRHWGRLGQRGGRIKSEHYENAALAASALQRQAERKRRRGYGDMPAKILG